MKIILASTPLPGHFNPLLAVGRILIAAGHEVVVSSGSGFRERAEAIGAGFRPLPAEADLDLLHIDEIFPERKSLPPGPPQLRFDMERIFLDTIPAQFAGLNAILRSFPADLILVDTLFGGTLPFALGAPAAIRPATAGLGVIFLPFHRDDGAPAGLGLPPATAPEQFAQYRAIAEKVEAGLLQPVQAHADTVLARLGAARLQMPYFDALVALHDLFLQPTVPGFEYPRRDLPQGVRFIGALPPPDGYPMPDAVAAALGQGKRIVLVTQGTVANFDLGQLLAPTLAGLAERTDLVVLAATGGRPITDIPGRIPANAIAAPFLPFDRIMKRMDVLVTNGGYGTVSHALSAGVPLVVAGATEDKPEVGARAAWSGTGIDLRTETPSAEQIREAVGAVLANPSYRARAQALSYEFGRYDAAREVCSLLERAVAERTQRGPTP
jgi:UDP:flavonoid glycosyltransferase YjiC (YdhE family)